MGYIAMRVKKIDPDWKLKDRIKISDAANVLGLSRSTFGRRRKLPGFPKVIVDGRLKYVRTQDLLAWDNNCEVDS